MKTPVLIAIAVVVALLAFGLTRGNGAIRVLQAGFKINSHVRIRFHVALAVSRNVDE